MQRMVSSRFIIDSLTLFRRLRNCVRQTPIFYYPRLLRNCGRKERLSTIFFK